MFEVLSKYLELIRESKILNSRRLGTALCIVQVLEQDQKYHVKKIWQ